MAELFDIVGEDFFKPFTSLFKYIYVDCLNIIYDSYRTELSYGADRDVLVAKLTYYFDSMGTGDIQFEDETGDLSRTPRVFSLLGEGELYERLKPIFDHD